MKKILLLLTVSVLTLVSCKNNEKTEVKDAENNVQKTEEVQTTPKTEEAATPDTITYIIAAERADCTGVGKMKCLQVKENKEDPWTLFYQGIDGFEYEEGYEYVVKVKRTNIENPPADASSIKYTLEEVVSKEKK